MSEKGNKSEKKLELRPRRIFSEEFKRQKVDLLVSKQISVKELSKEYGVTRMTVYRWLYKYSPHHQKGTVQVVQMESEATKTQALREQVARLERVIGQKQMEIDFLNEMIALAEKEYKVDIKKNSSTPPYHQFEVK